MTTRLERLKNECFTRAPRKWVFDMPQSAKGRRVLDIACGLGYDSMAWARAGKQPVGVDFVFELVKNASQLAAVQGLRIPFVVADAAALPFRDGSFDVSFSESLLEHVPKWEDVVREARRVLKQDGVLFIGTTNRFCPINREINHFHFLPLAA